MFGDVLQALVQLFRSMGLPRTEDLDDPAEGLLVFGFPVVDNRQEPAFSFLPTSISDEGLVHGYALSSESVWRSGWREISIFELMQAAVLAPVPPAPDHVNRPVSEVAMEMEEKIEQGRERLRALGLIPAEQGPSI